MKSIVVYKIAFLSWFLILSAELMAQKPAIDLISSQHQYRHPEVIMDTAYMVNPPVREAALKQLPPPQDREPVIQKEKKKRRQIGPSLDSLFQKKESKTPAREKSPAKTFWIGKRFNPVKFLLYITAIK
jgi:hypothetical protein